MANVKNYNLVLLFIGILMVFLASCSKRKMEAQIPSYISIADSQLSTTYLTQGSASEKITDAWVYLNNDLVGIYELPAKFPVQKEGTFDLKVYAGIKENGISGTRTRYLFFNPLEETVTLTKGETVVASPTYTYTSSTNFVWLEDFENASLPFTYTTGSDTTINKESYDVFEGSSSGVVKMTSTMDFFEMQSPAFTNLPKNGNPIFVEFNFKTNETILVGAYADTEQLPLIYLNVSDNWNKIYINFTELINSRPNAASFKIFFGRQASSTNPLLTSNPEFYFDNFKLIYF